MAVRRLFVNNAVSLLAAPISASATTLTVMAGNGAMFPSPGNNELFTVTLEDQSAQNHEIVFVTARTGDVFTILRGQEGTTARAWSAASNSDTLVDHRLTAGTLYYLKDEFEIPPPTDLTAINAALSDLQVALSMLDARVDAIPPPFDSTSIENTLTSVFQNIGDLQGRILAVEENQAAVFDPTELQADVSALQTQIQDLQNNVMADLSDMQINIDTNYTTLNQTLIALAGRVTSIEDSPDTGSSSYYNPTFPALTTYKQAIDYLLQDDAAISGQQVVDSSFTTEIASTKTNITLPMAYTPGSTAVYVGGLRQKRGVDFTESAPTVLQLQFALTTQMQADGQNVVVDYVVA